MLNQTTLLFQLRALAEQQNYQQLKQNCLDNLTENKKPSVLPLLALAQIHLDEGSAAQESLQQAKQQLDQLESDAQVDLSAVYLLLHQPKQALSILDPLLETEPDNAMALARRGQCHMTMGTNDLALADIERATELTPERMALWIQLAQIKLQKAQYKAAFEAVQQGQSALENRLDSLPEHSINDYQQQFAQLKYH